ncbi:Rho termination factor N-terminal domain-containing protein [Macrococcus animalis]|uniref:Rho termination factor N-terminal domain-containing protein n=1 Tax=Macrococcus animalis TaxID=3395467 RepID=UPI0039BE4CDC
MTNDNTIDIKEQEERKKFAVENFNNNSLNWYLEALSKDELKNICRNLGIKGFSSKNKEDLIKLITETFFGDYDILKAMLQTYDSGFKVVLDNITEQKENYVVFHYDIPDDVFLFYADGTELLFIPQDVKEHIQRYKQEHPEFKVEIDNIHFYRSALNLYGFVSLKQLAILKEQYYNILMTEEEIQAELVTLMPEYEALIKEGSVKHKELEQVNINLKALTHDKDYYVPALEDFKLYTNHFYIERTDEINTLVKYIEEGITEAFKGTSTGKLIINTILFGLRANETPEQILLHIDNIEENGFVKFEDRETLTQVIAQALYSARLWILNGHKREEVQNEIKLVPQQKKPELKVVKDKKNKNKKKPVQLKRKSKKRGKNKNIAHVAKLDDYRKN